jgi:hypothetical protein
MSGSNMGVGLDVGTMNIMAARQEGDKVATKRIRNAFLDLETDHKRSLRMSKVNYIEEGGQLIVLGDAALDFANVTKREARRPLARGLIAPGELEAQKILSRMVHHVLGDRLAKGEHCYYSVPAAPIDDPDQDVIYHREVFRKIITEHDYNAHPMNEAMAIIYSQCGNEQFSGLGVSFGSGMCNVALAFHTLETMSFSLARGGDWIDTHAAKAIGSTASNVCSKKEGGVDLMSPVGREAEAIALYVRALIRYCLENIAAQFRKVQNTVNLPEAIPFIVSGGTTRAGAFMDVFKEEFEATQKKGFPIKISEIRQAGDPMSAVAEGLLVLAKEEYTDL